MASQGRIKVLEALNTLSKSKRSTLYTTETAKGPLAGFVAHAAEPRGPLPPFTAATALQKVKAAENAWNSRDAAKVALAYTPDTVWRNRDEIFVGRDAVVSFLESKWTHETNYKLVKHLWCHNDDRIAVRFTYEYQRVSDGQWFRCHGNELWQFDAQGYMQHRDMSGNDVPIDDADRVFR
ncbi:hisitidine kinase [Achlya hypogyna]|uniref:Hisitidine kinase n=1 Tax=Achlya hypogyna TaxID=1202772 RepID=A0A1V9YFT7_ACHHY|nr:hisitidine kinase [Achlya hypogyna]